MLSPLFRNLSPLGTLKAAAAAFTPLSVAGCVLWLDAGEISLADGTVVDTWPDKSSAARNATATSTLRPTFYTNIVNGRPVVRFVGVRRMTLATEFYPAGWTVLTVMRKLSSSVILCGLTATAMSPGFPYAHFHHTGNAYVANRLGYKASAYAGTAWNVETSTSDLAMWRNGPSVTLGAFSDVADSTANFGSIGARSGESTNGDIAEVIAYDSVLSIADRQAVEDYLGSKYGVAITH